MRAHTRMLEALRETQVEQHAAHTADLATMRGEVRSGFQTITGLLTRLISDDGAQ